MNDQNKNQAKIVPGNPKSKFGISLPLVLVLPFLVQIIAAVTMTAYFSIKHSQKSIQDMAGQLMLELQGRIDEHLKSYLAVPDQINQLNKIALDLKQIDFQDLSTMERNFWQQSNIFERVS